MSVMTDVPVAQETPGRAAHPAFVTAFYDAYLARDVERLEAVLHEDIEWLISGPVDQFDFYGPRHGRDEVIEVIVKILPCYAHLLEFEFEHVLVHGERVAVYGMVRARQRDTGRAIRFRLAHFLRFVGGRLIAFRAVADTFDTAEQLVGHRIDVTRQIESSPLVPEDDLSVV